MYRFGTKHDLFTTMVRSWNVEEEEDHMIHLVHGTVEQDTYDPMSTYDCLVKSTQSIDYKPTSTDFWDTVSGLEGTIDRTTGHETLQHRICGGRIRFGI